MYVVCIVIQVHPLHARPVLHLVECSAFFGEQEAHRLIPSTYMYMYMYIYVALVRPKTHAIADPPVVYKTWIDT